MPTDTEAADTMNIRTWCSCLVFCSRRNFSCKINCTTQSMHTAQSRYLISTYTIFHWEED